MRCSKLYFVGLVLAFAVAPNAYAVDFVQGIDISSHQGNITAANWTSIKNAGIRFVFARVSLGSCCDFDANYVNNFNRAIAAGIPIGPYAVGYPHTNMNDPNDAVNEANYLVSLMTSYYQGSGLLLRPVLDLELPMDLSLSQSFVSQWVVKWATTVKAGLGVDPIIYTYTSYAASELNSTVTSYPLWIASYSTAPPNVPPPSVHAPWSDFKFWQYTNTGTVSGISGNVDRNVYKGTIQDMAANFIVDFLPGDYNGNGIVDAGDYTKWRDTLGQTVNFGTGADGDLSGVVDAADYNVWQSHFGQTLAGSGAGQATAAPEPSSFALLFVGIAALVARTRGRRK